MPKFQGYHIAPASEWVNYTEEEAALMRNAGGFPVNDAFMTIWNRPETTRREIIILYGTYGSSKTHDRILEHLLLCMTRKYFKCFYGRAVFDLAKTEFHSSIISVIKREGWEDLFEYSEKPNGTKEISCKATKNKFKPFGCDDEESIGKGWDDATHVFVDEMNQISFKQFGMLQSRPRKKGIEKAFTGCFNNCDVFEDHWIRTILLNKEAEKMDDKGNPISRNIIEHFSRYTDNYFIDHDEYRQQLIEQAGDDVERMDAYLNGLWGVKILGQPFYKMFSMKQVWQPGVNNDVTCEYDPGKCLWVSLDENVNPYLPALIFQSEGKDFYVIDEIAAKNPNNSLEWICGEICRRYKGHKSGMKVTGDATSKKEDVKIEKGKDLYVLAMGYLAEFDPERNTRVSNPNVKQRGNFINSVFGKGLYGLRVFINPKCTYTIRDFKNTAERPDGNGKDKTIKTVDGIRGVQPYGHFTDCFDYAYCIRYEREYLLWQQAGKSGKVVTGQFSSPNSY